MTKAERQQWTAIRTDEEAQAFVDHFLASRGPNFAADVASRAEQADKHLTLEKTNLAASKTLRGKLVILLGPPDKAFEVSQLQDKGSIHHDSPAMGAAISGGSASSPGIDDGNEGSRSMGTATITDQYHFSYTNAPGGPLDVLILADPTRGRTVQKDARIRRNSTPRSKQQHRPRSKRSKQERRSSSPAAAVSMTAAVFFLRRFTASATRRAPRFAYHRLVTNQAAEDFIQTTVERSSRRRPRRSLAPTRHRRRRPRPRHPPAARAEARTRLRRLLRIHQAVARADHRRVGDQVSAVASAAPSREARARRRRARRLLLHRHEGDRAARRVPPRVREALACRSSRRRRCRRRRSRARRTSSKRRWRRS